MQSSSIMPVLWHSWPLRPSRLIRRSHIVDTGSLLLILPPFQLQQGRSWAYKYVRLLEVGTIGVVYNFC